MKCYGISMVHSTLGLLSLLVCAVSSRAARYGDYSVAHMPQYEERREAARGDDFVSGVEDYNDKSPDAPARLDYKYQEDRHEKIDEGAMKDIDDESVWDKPRKKTRKTLKSHTYRNLNLDENSFDDIESRNQENDKFLRRRSRFRNNDFETESDKRFKHKLMNRNEDLDNVEDKSYYIQKDDVDRVDRIDEFEDLNHLRHRSTTQKKIRRKPRDRALHQPEKIRDNEHLKLNQEEFDALSDRDQYFGCTSARGSVALTDRFKMRKKIKPHDYDYGEFYDMQRVNNIKDRLPALLRQQTVRTTWSQSIRYFENRKRFERREASTIETTTESDPATTALSTTLKISPSPPITLSSLSPTATTEPKPMNTSELSLAEKSRLSILKKALKKESGRNISTSTKPPVLMQVTRKMQTVVVVEPQPPAGRRAGVVAVESPERLQRARRLMRRKLVAAARSIHDLTENWDEMVCDYIDVSLLDADCAHFVRLDLLVILLCALPYFLAVSWRYILYVTI